MTFIADESEHLVLAYDTNHVIFIYEDVSGPILIKCFSKSLFAPTPARSGSHSCT